MKSLLLIALLAAAWTYFADHADAADPTQKRPITVADLFQFARVADPQISPNGKLVVYQVSTVDFDANKSSTALCIADVDGKTPPRQLTSSGKRDAHPRWSPDGKKILFESNRSGTSQLYILDLAAGGEATKLTDISTGTENAIWSPNGQHIAFVSSVYPEFSELPFAESDKKNQEKADAAEKNPVKAKVFTKLFFRHWDSYVEDKRQHLFVIDVDGKNCHDVTPGDRDAYPTSSTFSSGEDFTFTPDSQHLVFTAVPEKGEAWTTNYDLCRVRITNNDGPSSGRKPTDWESLTKDNLAADSGPQFTPNGKKLAWRSQKKAGYEADKWNLLVVDVNPDGTWNGSPKNLTSTEDLSVNDFATLSASDWVFTADTNGAGALFRVTAEGQIKRELGGGSISRVTVSTGDRPAKITYSLSRLNAPAEVYSTIIATGGLGKALPINVSHANDKLLSQLDMPRPESVEIPVEGGVKMQMWMLKPPGFDDKKKWPVVYLVHGGPQGAWSDGWSNRWNPEVWAARGYVIAMPNPRGSTGFGQKFTDEISGDWGGKCYRDLVAGIEYVEKLPYVDPVRIGTAGASFGGYMQNWFAVNEIAKKFRCQINHCSVWNFESMWGTTEELWFDEYEHGGLPWEVPGKYAEFSPHKKAANLAKYKVPMLIIHNDLDFRCPIGQGHELFTALQRVGVPSRFVNFPDEGHWVLKPKNSAYWHQEVFAWLEKHVPPGGK